MNQVQRPKRKRKPIQMDEEAPKELWLVSYADMMTLIACFFILMMAFANYDPVVFQEKSQKFAEYFNKDKSKVSDTNLTKIQSEIVKHPELKEMTKITEDVSEMAIEFSGVVLFDQGQWNIKGEMNYIIDSLIDIIATVDKEFRILIEGHTAKLDSGREGQFVSDWQLSAARAASIADRFEYFGFDPNHISPVGKGSNQPLMIERDSKNRVIKEAVMANNRVIIKILTPINKGAKRLKMGMGVFFNEENE